MEFELLIACGDKSFGGTITIKDWDKATDPATAEMALKTAMGAMYNKAITNLVKEVVNKGDKHD